SPDWAARVADAFLRDTVARLRGFPAERVLAYSPPESRPFFAELVGDGFQLTPQADGDLGQRMAAFFTDLLAAGAEAVVLLGTDTPRLALDSVEQAFQALRGADVVLGPATDGGYYLVGIARRLPPIFDGIAWGGCDVLEQTVRRLGDPSW